MRKLIALLLAMVMVFALAACGQKTPSDDPGTQTPPEEDTPPADEPGAEDPDTIPPEERFVLYGLVGDVLKDIQIIRSDKLGAQSNEVKCAVTVLTTLKTMAGREFSIGTDYSGPYGTPEKEYEILIGTMVFHSPQAGHRPIHFELSFPHDLQNHTVFVFTVAIVSFVIFYTNLKERFFTSFRMT